MLLPLFDLGQHITNFGSKIFNNDLNSSYYLYNGAYLFCKAKTLIGYLMSPSAISEAPKCSEIRFRPGLRLRSRCGSSQRSPRPPSCIESLITITYLSRQENIRRKRKEQKNLRGRRKKCGQKGKKREGRKKKEDGGPKRFSCRGIRNLKLRH